jgi:hypothetical protein
MRSKIKYNKYITVDQFWNVTLYTNSIRSSDKIII